MTRKIANHRENEPLNLTAPLPQARVIEFGKVVKATSNNQFAETFIKRMFGAEVWNQFESGGLTEKGVECDTFSIVRRPTTAGNFEYGLVQKGARSIGAADATIRIISANSERLHFAALVDNHLFYKMDGVRYETLMGDEGRTDVIVRAGKGLRDPVCYVIESKTATSKDAPKMRAAAIQQVLSRLSDFGTELAQNVAVSVCIFDKTRATSASASEYYSHTANDVGTANDCLADMKSHLDGSGVHIETYLLTAEQIKTAFEQGDGSPLFQKPMSYAPAIVHGVEKSAEILENKAGGSMEMIYISKLKDARPHPKLNPSGASSSQNTRPEIEKIIMTLTHGILGSMFANYLEHLRAQKIGRAGTIISEAYRNLGSNMREIHLIKGSYARMADADLDRADTDFKIAYLTTNISAPNSQHSQEAYMRIKEAVVATQADTGRDASQIAELMKALGLNTPGDPTDPNERLHPDMVSEALSSIGNVEFKLFAEYVGNVNLIGHVFACENQAQSQRLSASSNASVKQSPPDMWLQRSRADVNRATSSLSDQCQKAGIPMPIHLPKSHDERFNQQLGTGVARVSIHEAAHWLSMDSWSKNEQLAQVAPKFQAKGKSKKTAGEDSPNSKNEAFGRAKAAFAEILDEPAASLAAQELWRNQRAYRNIFAASLGNTKAIYDEVDAHVFPAVNIAAKLKELRDSVRSELCNAQEGQVVIDAMLGKAGSKTKKNLKALLIEAAGNNLLSNYDFEGGKGNGLVTELQSAMGNAVRKYAKDPGSVSLDPLISTFEKCCDRLVDEMSSELNPSRLHGAAHCAMALGKYKARVALDSIEEDLMTARADGKSKPEIEKLAKLKASGSQAVLAEHFDKKILNQCKFWTNALSFDRLVGMSIQLTRSGTAKGSVIPCDYDMRNPDHRDNLEQTVKAAAAAAFSKIQELTDIPKRSKENIVSHEFRHTRSAANLAEGSHYPSLSEKLIALGVPELPVNFYEYFLKHKWAADLRGTSRADLDKDSSWVRPARAKP